MLTYSFVSQNPCRLWIQEALVKHVVKASPLKAGCTRMATWFHLLLLALAKKAFHLCLHRVAHPLDFHLHCLYVLVFLYAAEFALIFAAYFGGRSLKLGVMGGDEKTGHRSRR